MHPSRSIPTSSPASPIAQRLLLKALARIRAGRLDLEVDGQMHVFGDPEATLRARVRIRDARVFRTGLLHGEVGLGEAYMAGWWEADDLVAVVRIAVRNMAAFDQGGGFLATLGKAANRLLHRRRRNHVEGSRQNIGHHYDLGNDFYRLWLDPTLAYSCAVFESADQGLEEAQRAKFELICRKLQLGPDDHLLEIGTGWGGFALHAARTRGCRITTTTISQQQFDHARELFRREGVADRIELRLEDYRHLSGQFDKAVSIEMFEAVGLEYYDTYFGTVDRLLKPGGRFLLQTITMNERQFPAYIRQSDWIQKHVFPGAELASLSRILASLGRCTTLNLHHLEDIGLHYAHTLGAWRAAFLARRDEVRALGFDETFLRMWDYYLAYCEGAFAERYIGDAQLLLAKADGGTALFNEPW
ncbi:MAG: class I SAM-dependent methyltransferase [Holophagaceae bacterium]|uniref:Class I SAM-dependent methyltransferase n=1 Tax=Candidatus Geothrix skivensis TaxID=2954439 RepID=A0A9D7SHW7_9BACT|nr:class I SAM-dependent methyltransferase [Candidatus Geothrix skivensis]